MSLWYGDITLQMLNDLNKDTLGEFFNIKFTRLADDHLEATMPVQSRTKQPFGLLHGGASVALAETIGSVATWCAINRELFIGVGIEINANHIRPVTEGTVTARCMPIKVKGQIHIWDIRLHDQNNELCTVCRFTCMVVPKRG